MSLVWPLTALYAGPIAIWAYYRLASRQDGSSVEDRAYQNRIQGKEITTAQIAKGAMHCGAGCTLGDILAETLLLLVPAIALFLGWHKLWSDEIFSAWILDFIFAYAIGIAFQYFSIKPMHAEMAKKRAIWRSFRPIRYPSYPGRWACTPSWLSPISGSFLACWVSTSEGVQLSSGG